eukprot:ANDGO_01698.mRNA.1 Ribosomal RNA small subunit methyltransferase H
MNFIHKPVLLDQVCRYVGPRPGSWILDCTFGLGGYSRQFLKLGANVVALDRDPAVLPFAQSIQLERMQDAPADVSTPTAKPRFHFVQSTFSTSRFLLQSADHAGKGPPSAKFDAVVFDLGVSSMQLDDPARGFSFRSKNDGPLDMRMDSGASSRKASDLVNTLSEKELADLIYAYGEERSSRKIAKAIVEHRSLVGKLSTCRELASVIERILSYHDGKHPATRTFQALRIAVNRELEEIELGMENALSMIKPGGRIVAVSFHSLEDRIVKQSFQRWKREQKVTMLTGSPVVPDDAEIAANSRSRSAKLRACERLE